MDVWKRAGGLLGGLTASELARRLSNPDHENALILSLRPTISFAICGFSALQIRRRWVKIVNCGYRQTAAASTKEEDARWVQSIE